ncbi:ATP-binding protein [Pseudarthrobacter cellobiosi]|uniref:ATP-binding protein n=1 Tax=Pseudarthrobacter cellobiosi TaxID=2953654 RepID=UPI00208ED56F|nr:ATP-binding protein [Pseudarthrobacter sp. HLT1-5]MCO4253888.1 ATP-binding protein [Pseudarthrobacter sp. HLT1-5]
MSGVDTVRGINYQHCQAILIALDVAADDSVLGIRVEGAVDALDLEVIANAPGGAGPFVVRGLQMKSRLQPHTWARAELLAIVHRWAELPVSADSEFSLLTDGALGPSGYAVAAALDEARDGKYDAIAELLGIDVEDPLCAVMGRARIVSEPGSVEALLLSAEMEIMALLDTGPTHPDAEKDASGRVNELFRVISTRSGLPDLDDRFISRDEIVAVVGDIARLAEADRWTGSLAAEYLTAVASEQIDDLVVPTLSASWQSPPIRLEDLALVSGPLLMTGRTGSGKSTLARLWRRGAACAGGKVVVCHAEAYLAQRLDRLVADAVGTAVGRTLSRGVGRQVLGDPSVTVILDGVSELPQQVRSELAADLRTHLAGAHGSRVVGVGRDEGVGATVFPASVTVQRLYPLAFGRPERLTLTAKVLGEPESGVSTLVTVDGGGPAALAGSGGGDIEDFSPRCYEALAQVEHALADAAGNPMLLELALQLVAGGVPFTDRASVYELTVSRMSDRANGGDVRLAVAVLGVVFAELLDEGRRYANPLEWERMIAGAAVFLEERGVATDVPAIREAVARSGLVNAVITGIGHTTLRVPVHDSFADYFAARAHADGLVLLPETLLENDENRLWFSSQMRMLNDSEVLAVAKQLPFSLVRVSESDHNTISGQAPGIVAALLNAVLPDDTDVEVTMWRTANGKTMAQAGTGATTWVDPAQAPAVFAGPTVVAEDSDGPTAVAVRLWRLILRQRLRRDRRLRPRAPQSRQEACDQLSAHCREVIAALTTVLAEVAPPGTINRLRETIGPLGMTGVVYERQGRGFGLNGWPVRYRHSEAVDLTAASDSSPPSEERTGVCSAWTDVVSRVSTSPEVTAAKAVGEAVTKLTRNHWL